jgi:hypothetical protein
MSSLRPAKIVASLFHAIGGSLAEPADQYGPSCSCEGCVQAWRRNQSPEQTRSRATLTLSRRRVTGG